MNEAIQILSHEYLMALYGVLAWQVWELIQSKNKITFKTHVHVVLKSMFWASLVVVFDDELIAQYDKFAELDYTDMPKWGYTLAGFAIDIIVSFVKK